jgi:hypothetical protein
MQARVPKTASALHRLHRNQLVEAEESVHYKSLKISGALALMAGILVTGPRIQAQSPSQPAPVLVADLPTAPTPAFEPDQQSSSQQGQPKPQQQNPGEPNLGDLGFSKAETQPNPQLQALLNRRTHMLKVHQTLGIVTLIPMAATLITGPMAKGKGRDGQPYQAPTTANLDTHAALGGVTALLYGATAYYAIAAPSVPGVKHKGPIKFHEALAFIHGPGMIATAVLGAMAYKQENAGEKVHGAASFHGPVAVITVGSYAAAMLAVSWPPFHHHS